MRRSRIIVASIGAALSTLVALASYRYLLPDWPGAPPPIAANSAAVPLLPIHAIFAATALLIGPLQFLGGLRRSRPHLHRAVGFTYVLCCILGGTSGLALAVGSTAGPVAAAGFFSLGTAWIVATSVGLSLAMRRRFEAHRRWMIRSYTLTFAAVTLRIYLPIPLLMGFEFVEGYRAIAFLCWVPNLVAAELYIALTRARRGRLEPVRAA